MATTTGLTGNMATEGTLNVTGKTTLVFASTTGVSLSGNLMVNGMATTTGLTGNMATEGTLNVTGKTTLGFASTTGVSLTQNLLINGNATTTGSSGQFATQGFIGAGGTTTPATEFAATSAATTTLYLDSSLSGAGGCLELDGPDNTVYRIYINLGAGGVGATTTGSALRVEAGACK
ncbi:MAG: hypothetical protein A3A16_00360 [Candidatus Harrisonbacteria bacterium RIFCSPLOWO2_01_FULL_44_18]|uniref:Uncharacterized protein n=1 Tax=Candidatus Harrisonbacteria bacterium RIFCSPLOWO2_01_FULL_44_18 TaxID=1798407 RepID=A0A1G1ZPJ5_9BACT|nr:MAG: hypothetical protein A3A16_00360 [Candidatus Harrisonbacteria bacterium RIFCSPLOWO2_01_FULL_44_18]